MEGRARAWHANWIRGAEPRASRPLSAARGPAPLSRRTRSLTRSAPTPEGASASLPSSHDDAVGDARIPPVSGGDFEGATPVAGRDSCEAARTTVLTAPSHTRTG